MSQTVILAIACVADSSLIVATEWARILNEYLAPLFARLVEVHQPHSQFRLAFITYGVDSTRPNPLLCERFFQFPGQLQRELREEPSKLGIGQTGMGASSGGMAAIEGVVAALEMFDKLRSSIESIPSTNSQTQNQSSRRAALISHVIHFAACPPDTSLNPMWNKDPNYDALTWRSLPEEFKKREINYSMILVRPLPRFKEIYSAMPSTEPHIAPWFNVAPHHTILLSGFPSKGVKRSTESSSASPEQKRPRLNSTSKSTHHVTDNAPTDSHLSNPEAGTASPTVTISPPGLAPASAPVAVQPAPPAPRPTLSFAQLSPSQQQQFIEQYRRLQIEIQQEAEAIKTATRDGRSPEILTAMKTEFTKKFHACQKLGFVLANAANASKHPNSSLPPSASAPQLQPSNNTSPELKSDPSAASAMSNVPSGQSTVPGSISEPRGLHTSASAAIPNNQTYPPEVMAQINKLIGQQHQQQQNQNKQDNTSPNVASSIKPTSQVAKWQGLFSWGGVDPATQSRREIVISVAGQCATTLADPLIHTWPTNLYLSPSQDKMVPPLDFQNWVKKHKPTLCQFAPMAAPGTDAMANEVNFRQLAQMLGDKNIYALAAWDLPNGTRNSNNLLLLPFKGVGLVGAAFPSTGIPEMPRLPTHQPQQLDQAQLMAQFNKLPPERQALMKQYYLRKQNMDQGSGRDPSAVANENVAGSSGEGNAQFPLRMPGFVGGSGTGVGLSTQPAQQLGAGVNVASGGVPAVSSEMMQSFMQRKMDGGGGHSSGGLT